MIGTRIGNIIIWDFLTAKEMSNLTEAADYIYRGDDIEIQALIKQRTLQTCPISVIARQLTLDKKLLYIGYENGTFARMESQGM